MIAHEKLSKVMLDAQQLLSEMEASAVEKQSLLWYALNNLRAFVSSVNAADSRQDVVVASQLLERFAVDSLDWDSALFRRVHNLCTSARRAVSPWH